MPCVAPRLTWSRAPILWAAVDVQRRRIAWTRDGVDAVREQPKDGTRVCRQQRSGCGIQLSFRYVDQSNSHAGTRDHMVLPSDRRSPAHDPPAQAMVADRTIRYAPRDGSITFAAPQPHATRRNDSAQVNPRIRSPLHRTAVPPVRKPSGGLLTAASPSDPAARG
jgi:hypothetical protein